MVNNKKNKHNGCITGLSTLNRRRPPQQIPITEIGEGIYDIWYPHRKKKMQQKILYLIRPAICVFYHILKINFNMSIASILKTSRKWGRCSSANNLHKKFQFSRSCYWALNQLFHDLIIDLSNGYTGLQPQLKSISDLHFVYFLYSVKFGVLINSAS